MTKAELLRIVQASTNPDGSMSGDELEQLTETFAKSIPHPGGTDLLFYPENWRLSVHPSPDEIVNEAMNWKPRTLAMQVTAVAKHPKRRELFVYSVELPGRIRTQIVSPMKLKVGDVCGVALSGVILSSGEQVTHGFVHHMYSTGKILGLTDKPLGTTLDAGEFRAA